MRTGVFASHADERGGVDPVLRNAAAIDECPNVNVHAFRYQPGRHKLEFVDRKRVLISNGDNTMPANYVEEKDGRVSITGENLAVTLSREGRILRGWAVPITRTK